MYELKNLASRSSNSLPREPQFRRRQEYKQQRMMAVALALLLAALGFVLYRDRDFWFPDTQEAEDQPQVQETAPAANDTSTSNTGAKALSTAHKKSHSIKPRSNGQAAANPSPADSSDTASLDSTSSDSPDSSASPIAAKAVRTVLPPLEVEVVAGDAHRTVRPGSNSLRVDLQTGSPPMEPAAPAAASNPSDTAAGATSNAAEHVQMSADAAEVVSSPVKPGYPLLARQMKVQGSVILQALIGRDGLIQDLHVISGPPILASAAEQAVRQWHFKPHYQGAAAVETQAMITVNFTISTN